MDNVEQIMHNIRSDGENDEITMLVLEHYYNSAIEEELENYVASVVEVKKIIERDFDYSQKFMYKLSMLYLKSDLSLDVKEFVNNFRNNRNIVLDLVREGNEHQ